MPRRASNELTASAYVLEAVQGLLFGYAVSDQDGFSHVMHGDRDAKGDSDSSLTWSMTMPAYLRFRSGEHTTPQRASCDEFHNKVCHVRSVTVTCFKQRNMAVPSAALASQRHSLRMYLA